MQKEGLNVFQTIQAVYILDIFWFFLFLLLESLQKVHVLLSNFSNKA